MTQVGGCAVSEEPFDNVLIVAHDCDTRWLVVSPVLCTVVVAAAGKIMTRMIREGGEDTISQASCMEPIDC